VVHGFEQACILVGQRRERSEAPGLAANGKAELAQELLERRLLLDYGESLEVAANGLVGDLSAAIEVGYSLAQRLPGERLDLGSCLGSKDLENRDLLFR
jgi:hypothetical protein